MIFHYVFAFVYFSCIRESTESDLMILRFNCHAVDSLLDVTLYDAEESQETIIIVCMQCMCV